MLALSQILALAIFLGVFTALIIGKVHRYIPALIGAALTITLVFLFALKSPGTVLSALNVAQIGEANFWISGYEPLQPHGVNWQTIIFIGGMMVMVEGLGAVGFFRWLCLYTARLVNCRVIPISMIFILLSGFFSMFIDSITVLLFMSSVTIELGHLLKFDPVPLIIAEVFAANTGGSATMAGDPPNIIIGTSLGYTFSDFMVNTGPIAWVGMAITLGYFYVRFRRSLSPSVDSSNMTDQCPMAREAILSPRWFKIQVAIFISVVVLLVTHAQTGLSVAMIGCVAAGATLLTARKDALKLIRRIDWRTLLFFFGLFVIVSGLEETGLLKIFADYIREVSGGSELSLIALILWVSAFASAVVDNIPFAATMVPVISYLSQATGVKLPTLAWTLALGTDIGGNATPIGASANIVGIAIAERAGYRVSWGRFLKYALPAMVMVVGVCHLLLVARYT